MLLKIRYYVELYSSDMRTEKVGHEAVHFLSFNERLRYQTRELLRISMFEASNEVIQSHIELQMQSLQVQF
jgi:hypothetical protein